MTRAITKTFTVLLFIYSCIFSFSLFFGALSRGYSFGSLISTLLFLPVVYYFLREIGWQFGYVTGGFRLGKFLVQKDWFFATTILLYLLAILITFLKARGIIL